ncbi:60S acidic ribosomal protein P1 [Naegleria gruberi]|uniref:60S acidic ribosomal protein P1 n=1 Tax=Naegleria gruberi TaxID=5762 RepID=D2V2C3_NAEGR|nr:60S acidic ribosomal protein P1 [Naegleria gruberi]EFC48875.1 60S acidic ribosomal protein P1 [Naegleria gruberi]|eukprot:XP_002681619.1 60S acidic ribosomal protein P1 [Naegleria gruberi strain NEG-M]
MLPSTYTKDKVDELACTYAAFILHDEGINITADKIKTLTEAAGVTVEPFWPSVFAKFFSKHPVSDILSNIGGSASSGAAVAASTDAPATAAAVEEKKPEPEEEEEEMGFGGLF